jgi:hypothetical protein
LKNGAPLVITDTSKDKQITTKKTNLTYKNLDSDNLKNYLIKKIIKKHTRINECAFKTKNDFEILKISPYQLSAN